jgi:Uncharacterized conserved protein
MGYMVDLEAFHGPMDLLLYLIDENQIDIYDIPVALLSEQFMAYLERSGEYELDMMGDFLVMASYLLHLKARMLLPAPPGLEEEGEGDPREELVQKLQQYRKYKEAAEQLVNLQMGKIKRVFFSTRDAFAGENEVLHADLRLLVKAYQAVLERFEEEEPQMHLPQEDVNVHEKMDEIMQVLYEKEGGVSFGELFARAVRRRELLGLFLALLELVRQQKVAARQEESFGDIRIFLRVGNADVDEG